MGITDEIKERLDIVDFIGRYIDLKKSGRNYKGLCPFHHERTPSFVVFPETQTWHCFGACNTGGDIFTFLMRKENLDFGEALEQLAHLAGIPLRPPDSPPSPEAQYLNRLREALAAATTYAHNLLLHHPEAEPARDYLRRRGLTMETAERFQLGYTLNTWRSMSTHLLEQGFTRDELIDAGLLVQHEDGTTYDRFRGRLLIPICDIRGRVIGFGARVLDDSQPKYINSPQTPLFDKSHVLFGIHLAKGAIRAQGEAVIVEGYMDVMQAHQAGYANLVASMGTALTEHQLRLLKRLTRRLILALDPDTAGSQGVLRGLETAREVLDRRPIPVATARGWIRYETQLDTEIRVLTLPKGKDPDRLIRETPALWPALIEAARPVTDYYIDTLTADLDLSQPAGKEEAVRRLAPILREIGNPITQLHYVQKLARRIHTDERILWQQIRQAPPPPTVHLSSTHNTTEGPRPFGLEEYTLHLLLSYPDAEPIVLETLSDLDIPPLEEEDFTNPLNRFLFTAWQNETETDWDTWVSHLPPPLQEHLKTLLEQEITLPDEETIAQELTRCILRLRERRLIRQNTEVRELLEDSLEAGDPAGREYLAIVEQLTSHLRTVQYALSSSHIPSS